MNFLTLLSNKNFAKKIIILIISTIYVQFSFSQDIIITGEKEIINLNNNLYVFKTQDNNIEIENIKNSDWKKSETGGQFGVIKEYYWLKFEFNNQTDSSINYNFYMPYHHVGELIFYKYTTKYMKIEELGTVNSYSSKREKIPGYTFKNNFEPGKSAIIVKVNHLNMSLRVSSFLLKDKQLKERIQSDSVLFVIWHIVLLLAFLSSLLFYSFTNQKIFFYYLMMNLGILFFIGIEIGDFFLFLDSDKYFNIIDIKHLSVLIVLCFFPRFLNSLTPIKRNSEKMWKTIKYTLILYFILWFICLFPTIKHTTFAFYTVNVLILVSVYIFLLQLYMLIKVAIRKEKNSRILFFIYFFYIFAVIFDVVMPNIGLNPHDLGVYDTLIKISIIEVFVFMILIGKEFFGIYKERNKMLVEQRNHQKQILKTIVKSQEKERNEIGRDLHDMISGNINVIKQNIDSSDSELVKLIDNTIESVRNMSHGLVTPKVKGVDFKNEIIDLCLLSSNSKMIVEYYFHNMKEIKNEEISTHLYRIIQELLQNAMKHSNASKVYIQFLKENNSLFVSYEDNGKGVKLTPVIMNKYGFVGIKNRISLIGGKIEFESSEGNGFYVHIDVKLD